MVRCGHVSCRTGLKCPCTRKPDKNRVALNFYSSVANGSCIRTKETYFSAMPIDIEILKVSFDWASTTVFPMRLQHAAIRGVMRRSTMRDKNENKDSKD
jgi:hypothetical protein